jgi:hypothetical protein
MSIEETSAFLGRILDGEDLGPVADHVVLAPRP